MAALLRSARPRTRDQPDQAGGERQRGQLLRAARKMEGEHEREPGGGNSAARGSCARGGLRQRERGRQPGRAAEQPERRRARHEMARGGECDRRERRSGRARAQLPRERVGAERGDQVVERRHGAQRVDRVEQPGGEQHRRVGHPRLGIGQEGLARERPGCPVGQVTGRQPVVQEARERRVERRQVGGRGEPAAERERGEHSHHRDDHGSDGPRLAPHRGSHGVDHFARARMGMSCSNQAGLSGEAG